jgi:PEP-CTERM motif
MPRSNRSLPTALVRRTLVCVGFLAALATGPAAAAPTLPNFAGATFSPGAPIHNPYFPLLDTLVRVYSGTDEDGNVETFETQLVGAGPVILGVRTVARRDREFKGGRLVEDTFDYYAQDTAGNVWYLGEDVTNYRYDSAGNLIGTDSASAWRAGVNGAQPGFAMPAAPSVGENYYQEYAPADDALDNGTTFAVGVTRHLAVGSFFDVVQVFETTELNPEAREFKYYARGFGLIRVEEGLDEDLMHPELTVDFIRLSAPVPEPSTWALMALGLIGLVKLRRHASSSIEAPPRVA